MLITLLIMAYSPMDGYSRQVTATCRRWGITTNMFYVSVGAAIMALSSLALASERAVPPPALQFLQALTIPASVSYTHLPAHETSLHLVCRLLLL